MTRVRALVLYADTAGGRKLSYQVGWPQAFAGHRGVEAELIDVRRPLASSRVRRALRRRSHDAVVLLHSVFSNGPNLGPRLADALAASPIPKTFFVGNEYKLMPAKVAFAERLGVSLLVSQLSSPRAHDLYRKRLGCSVVGIPSAGLDPSVFRPGPRRDERPVDLGYRGYASPLYLGHDERRRTAAALRARAEERGLVVDVSLDPADRLDREGWASFLQRCKGQLGTEAGGDHFELTDELRDAVNAHLARHPDAELEEIHSRFFADRTNPVSGRALSGRVVEAAATKTVQLLVEGEYGGYFDAGVHYIPIAPDHSNLDSALDSFLDEPTAERVAEAAYEVAVTRLTYERLVDRFLEALATIPG